MKKLFTLTLIILASITLKAQCGFANFNYSESGYNVTFVDASVAGSGITIVSYGWDFGDGNLTTIASPIHTYQAPGFYTVKHWFTGHTGCNSDIITKSIMINTTVPLQLTAFNASVSGKNALLQWGTIDETNFSHFDIQKSADNVSFETIGSVHPSSTKAYTFSDGNLFRSSNFYRLKMIDKDGSFQFSKTVAINNTNHDLKFSMVNPSNQGTISISLENYSESPVQVQVLDITGKIKTSIQTTPSNGRILVKHSLPAGSYAVRINQGAQQPAKVLIVQ